MHIPRWGPLGWLAAAPEEVWFLLRIGAYAFFIGTVYWFVSYEAAGTALLYGFGLAAGAGTVILGLAARHARTPNTEDTSTQPDGPFGDESGRIPSPSLAPFAVGLGAAVAGLGLVLGPWLIGVGLLTLLVGATEWLAAAGREYRAVESSTTPDTAEADTARRATSPMGAGQAAGRISHRR